LTLLDLNI